MNSGILEKPEAAGVLPQQHRRCGHIEHIICWSYLDSVLTRNELNPRKSDREGEGISREEKKKLNSNLIGQFHRRKKDCTHLVHKVTNKASNKNKLKIERTKD